MLSLGFHRVIKAASIAEKKHNPLVSKTHLVNSLIYLLNASIIDMILQMRLFPYFRGIAKGNNSWATWNLLAKLNLLISQTLTCFAVLIYKERIEDRARLVFCCFRWNWQ
jgi:hypothetical protein